MKMNRNLYLFATALVAGTVGMTSCSNEEITPNNPTFDGESVKTQFAINIPAAGKNTRLTQDIVQGQDDPTFRGMSNIKLIPFNAEPEANTAFTSDAIILDEIAKEGGLTNGAKFYSDVQIPVGTSWFLFYAEATRQATSNDKDNGAIVVPESFDNGDLLNAGGLGNINQLEFSLKEINTTRNTQAQEFLITALDAVTLALYNNMTGDDALQVAYNNLVTLKAGSGASILETVQRLYNMVKDGTEPSADYNITKTIKDYFKDDGSGNLSYNENAEKYSADASDYPTQLGLPAGAAQVKATINTGVAATFEYNTTDYSATFASYAYPAALYYYAKTAAKTDDDTHSDKWGGTVTDWGNFVDANYDGTSVTAATKSVVLENKINYAVARFDVSPKFGSDITGKVPDQQGVYRDIASNFVLTGILVGQQNPVDYAFAWKNATTDKIKTIYDASITQTAITDGQNPPTFYTLVLQSEDGTSAEKPVNFALEFKNNGEDFYGIDGNIIPSGGTFYLVGKLSNYKEGAKVTDYVFQQDHHTVANITIKSLKDAYNTIPDLRKTQLELGLYVDLTWEQGLSQDVVIE